MKKMLIDYIREETQCNFADIYDYFKDLNQCGDELKAKYLVDLIIFIHEQEQSEKLKETASDYTPNEVLKEYGIATVIDKYVTNNEASELISNYLLKKSL